MSSDVSPLKHAMRKPKQPPKQSPYVQGFAASLVDTTDLRIKLGRFTWKVHSKLMIEQSSFFKVACNRSWKEGQTREIILHDDDPEIFARLLQCVYTHDYDGTRISTSGRKKIPESLSLRNILAAGLKDLGGVDLESRDLNFRAGLVIHFHVYDLADKYDMTSLREYAQRNITDVSSEETEDTKNLLPLAQDPNFERWKELIKKDDILKEAIARKIACSYVALEEISTTLEEISTDYDDDGAAAGELLRLLRDDPIFCLKVLHSMSDLRQSAINERDGYISVHGLL